MTSALSRATRTLTGLLLLVPLAACGGGDERSASGPAPESTEATPSSPSTQGDTASSGELHPPVQRYVDAVNRQDLDSLVASFSPAGVVIDVGRRIEGRDAIRRWADREVIGGTLRVIRIAEQRPNGQRLLVHFSPGGSGGFQAYYDFTTAGGVIVTADLTYA